MEYFHERDQMVFMRGYNTALLDMYCVLTGREGGPEEDHLKMLESMLMQSKESKQLQTV